MNTSLQRLPLRLTDQSEGEWIRLWATTLLAHSIGFNSSKGFLLALVSILSLIIAFEFI